MGSYSRTGYMAIKKETTENVAVTPTVFVPFNNENIVTDWGGVFSQAVVGSRNLYFRPVDHAVPPPSGTIVIDVEPLVFGHFLRGVCGSSTSGRYIPITSASGTFTVGETITGGSSSATAVITAVSSEDDYLLTGAITGTFTAGETITGGTSAVTATLTKASSSVYGHEYILPQTSIDDTYTLEIAYDNEAYRYTGVRFGEIKFNQINNIITAAITVTARNEFKFGRVTAVTASGAGSKTITVDQTTGLAVSDVIKAFRPSTGAFLDFSGSSVKTHTVASIVGETSFTVTNLQTSLAVGDLIALSPQTETYSIGKEFIWAGGTVAKLSTSVTAALTATQDYIEDYEITLSNKLEPRHAAVGSNVIHRFPARVFTAGFEAMGKIKRTRTDFGYMDKLRQSTQIGMDLLSTGPTITAAPTFNYLLDVRVSDLRLEAFNGNTTEDEIITEDMPFHMFNSASDGWTAKALLVNTVSTYAS